VVVIEPGAIATPIWERGVAAADTLWEAMPPAAHERYGKLVASLRTRGVALRTEGEPVQLAVDTIMKSLTAPRPRTRYVIGRQAQVQALLGRVLPDRAVDALLARLLNNR